MSDSAHWAYEHGGGAYRSDETSATVRTFEPVEIVHVQNHPFKKWTGRTCWDCKKAKTHPDHHGCVPSLNVLGDGNRFQYRAIKTAWQHRFTVLLEQADLPRPLARVVVEGEITFPDRRERDQGNYRALLEKALGDALVEGGWLAGDEFYPVSRFEFGGLVGRHVKGTSQTRLMVFPTPPEAVA